MAVRTATGGKADFAPDVAGAPGAYVNIPEVRKWTLDDTTDPKKYASSSTAGAQKRIGGIDDFKLTVDVYTDAGTRFDAGSLGIKKKAIGFFKLYEDATTFFIAPAFIDSVNYIVDIEGGEIIGATINASSNGNITYP